MTQYKVVITVDDGSNTLKQICVGPAETPEKVDELYDAHLTEGLLDVQYVDEHEQPRRWIFRVWNSYSVRVVREDDPTFLL